MPRAVAAVTLGAGSLGFLSGELTRGSPWDQGTGGGTFCPPCSPPAALPGTRSSREGIFTDYIVNVLLKFGCPFPAICPWQLPSAEASPPDSQHRSCQSRPHPSSRLTGPRDHLLVGMTSFPHPPAPYGCLLHLKAVPEQTPAISWIPNCRHISILFPPSSSCGKKYQNASSACQW